MSTQTWTFHGLDTWFFRESRPHARVGGTELGSVFPPPARTLAGAIRTALGEALGVSWQRFRDDSDYRVGGVALRRLIGLGDDLGALRLQGPWLSYRERRLYPLPLNVIARAVPGEHCAYDLGRLVLGPVARCDLGSVRLPLLAPELGPGFKPPTPAWVDREALSVILAGGTPGPDALICPSRLYAEEARVGIARDPGRRAVREGMLYQTRHLRPTPETAVEVDVAGIDPPLAPIGRVRLGGEGRLAAITTDPAGTGLPEPPGLEAGDGLILTLLTTADFGPTAVGRPFGIPPGFTSGEDGIYRGELAGVPLRLYGALVGKPLREGGWDLVRHAPRPVTSLVPPGSLWFCRPEGDTATATRRLHGAQVGYDPALGRGLLAVGRWPANESIET